MEKTSWNNCVRNEEVLHTHTIKSRKDNWIGHILHSHCPLKHVIEGKIGGGI
jgi:hypothetical protein